MRENPLITKNYNIWSNTGSLPAENDDIDSIRAYQNILNNIFSFSFRYGWRRWWWLIWSRASEQRQQGQQRICATFECKTCYIITLFLYSFCHPLSISFRSRYICELGDVFILLFDTPHIVGRRVCNATDQQNGTKRRREKNKK